ncbi:MAG: (Fe-S)-binding protein [Desulfovibrio sp.]|nr:(Fe-S)-binding protein [Desulfovibrio sp.]
MKRGCTQCGECLNVCPVYRQFTREEYSPKGKRLLMEPLAPEFGGDERAAELNWESVRSLARLCAGCDRCRKACARKLSTADLLADVRATHPHWTQHFWQLWIARMGPLWPSLGLMATLVPDGLTPKPLKPLHDTAKILADRGEARPWGRIRKNPESRTDVSKPVLLFSGCTANNVRKKWSSGANDLLLAWGYELSDPGGFVCCGGTMHHAGRYGAQRAMEGQNVEYWRKSGKPRIAVFCASCFHSLHGYAGGVLTGNEAGEWLAALTPVSVLLAGAEVEHTEAKPAAYGYHQPCHWGDNDNDIKFLQRLFPGLHKGTGLCCGMGGILQMSNPGLSRRMAESTLDGFPGAISRIVTGCSGCVMQLNAAAGGDMRIEHWLDLVSL